MLPTKILMTELNNEVLGKVSFINHRNLNLFLFLLRGYHGKISVSKIFSEFLVFWFLRKQNSGKTSTKKQRENSWFIFTRTFRWTIYKLLDCFRNSKNLKIFSNQHLKINEMFLVRLA